MDSMDTSWAVATLGLLWAPVHLRLTTKGWDPGAWINLVQEQALFPF